MLFSMTHSCNVEMLQRNGIEDPYCFWFLYVAAWPYTLLQILPVVVLVRCVQLSMAIGLTSTTFAKIFWRVIPKRYSERVAKYGRTLIGAADARAGS